MMSPVSQNYDPSCNSPVSEYQYHQYHHRNIDFSYYQNQNHDDIAERNPEEDELLDVIAKWQET